MHWPLIYSTRTNKLSTCLCINEAGKNEENGRFFFTLTPVSHQQDFQKGSVTNKYLWRFGMKKGRIIIRSAFRVEIFGGWVPCHPQKIVSIHHSSLKDDQVGDHKWATIKSIVCHNAGHFSLIPCPFTHQVQKNRRTYQIFLGISRQQVNGS